MAGVALHVPVYDDDGEWTTRYCLELYGVVSRPSNDSVRRVLEEALTISSHPLRLAIEDQYIGPKLRGAPRRALTLSAHRWEVIAEDHHIVVEWVNPQTWATKVLDLGRVKRERKKAVAVGAISGHYRIKVSEDEADAVCIGRHVVQQLERDLGGFIVIETSDSVRRGVW